MTRRHCLLKLFLHNLLMFGVGCILVIVVFGGPIALLCAVLPPAAALIASFVYGVGVVAAFITCLECGVFD
jgi:hypothetical protein